MQKTRVQKSHATVPLRDGSMRFLKFSHETTPPRPIRGSLESFLILAAFHLVFQVLK